LVTSQLLESGVEFVACDNFHANRLTIQILAAMAEHEGRLISERTKAGLAAARARGVVFGSKNLTPEARRLGQIAAALARATRTKAAYRDLVPTISSLRASGMSTKVIAVELNAAGQRNQYGRRWNSTAVNNLCRRENIIPLPGIFQRRTSAFREIQERGVIAAKENNEKQLATAYALALPLAREAHAQGLPRREIARILNAAQIASPREKIWRGMSVLILLRRSGLVEAYERRIHQPAPEHVAKLVAAGSAVRRRNAVAKRVPYLALIHKLLEAGYSKREVATTLNEFAYRPPRGSRWNARQLAGVLRRSQLAL